METPFSQHFMYNRTRHLLAFACLLCFVTSLPAEKPPAVILPPRAFNHGDPRLLCTPTTLKDIVLVFSANYLAHVATVKLVPGARMSSIILTSLYALVFPYSGLTRGLESIFRRAVFSKTDLEMAAQAGALCIVVRSHDWYPAPIGGKYSIPGVTVQSTDGTAFVGTMEGAERPDDTRYGCSKSQSCLNYSQPKTASAGAFESRESAVVLDEGLCLVLLGHGLQKPSERRSKSPRRI